MTDAIYPWENTLLRLATVGQESESVLPSHQVYEKSILDRSYNTCREMTAHHSKTFYLAARLLPADKRAAIHALYAFCRTTDDLVDHPNEMSLQTLSEWREACLDDDPGEHAGILPAWIHTRMAYKIPLDYTEQLLDGVERDLKQNRYQTFEELASYCYGVASTVGLMYISIVGYRSAKAIPYAIRMGVALQMTNILRDVAEDWQNGRLYLPLEELAAFGLDESDIQNGIVSEAWRRFMRYQIERIDCLYDSALPGIPLVNPKGQLALYAAVHFYRGILRDIEAHDYDVFSRRAHLSAMQKLRQIPKLWWQTRVSSDHFKAR